MRRLTAIGTPALFGEPGDDNQNEGTTPIFGGADPSKTAGNFSQSGGSSSNNLTAGMLEAKSSLFSGGAGQSLNPNQNSAGAQSGAGGFELPSWWPWAAAAGGGVLVMWYLSTRPGK
jgi:hypothetical protein